MTSFGLDTVRSSAARGVLFGIALGMSVLARPVEAVRIEEVPTGMSGPWGVGFSRTFTTYVVGGSKFADNVVEEVGQVVWPDFGAIDLRELPVSPLRWRSGSEVTADWR
jgi:hypothetical protein